MSQACCSPTPSRDISYRRVLWIALFANAAMFFVELAAAVFSGSSALAADAADFLAGFVPTMAVCAALTALGAVAGLWVPRRPRVSVGAQGCRA